MKIAFLLVTCCLERSRSEILAQVIGNLQKQAPEIQPVLDVFDNASTEEGTIDVLKDCFSNVYQADHNVGYWTAVDWWLQHLTVDPPAYTYVIESDMMHYDFNKIWTCADYLDVHPDVGAVRLHEYSIENYHLYNKDKPLPNSRRNLWQSHTNKVTGNDVQLIEPTKGDVWETTFLTQLPALNRYETLRDVFAELGTLEGFIEPDFQRLYWQRFQKTGILDGGIYHCDLNTYGTKTITGSWTNPAELERLGYQATRAGRIMPRESYTVVKV